MDITTHLTVKGTAFYKAREMLERGLLSPNVGIRLQRQPNNPHDSHAVAILLKKNGAMLGHVARESAPKYSYLVKTGRIKAASVKSISVDGHYVGIKICVVFRKAEDSPALIKIKNEIASMPPVAGVYEIINHATNRTYIGSSQNIRKRFLRHLNSLESGNHDLDLLQREYSEYGPGKISLHVISYKIPIEETESDYIQRALDKGTLLYNLTEDGQGRYIPQGFESEQKTVSDKRLEEKEQQSERQRRTAEYKYKKQKENIERECEKTLNSLLPRGYMGGIVLFILFPLTYMVSESVGLHEGIAILCSFAVFFLMSSFLEKIKDNATNKVKISQKYQAVIAEKEKKLHQLKKEFRVKCDDQK